MSVSLAYFRIPVEHIVVVRRSSYKLFLIETGITVACQKQKEQNKRRLPLGSVGIVVILFALNLPPFVIAIRHYFDGGDRVITWLIYV